MSSDVETVEVFVPGIQGPPAAPTLSIGNVTALETDQATAIVRPLATPGAYELSLGLPRGRRGFRGDPGPAVAVVGETVVGNIAVFADDTDALQDGGPLGTAAATDSADYATAAQGLLADSAVQPADLPGFGALATRDMINGNDFSGADLPIEHGGTGASSADAARNNLGLGTVATTNAESYATAAQGVLADGALQRSGGTLTGSLTHQPIDLGTATSGTITVDASQGNWFEVTIDGSVTLEFTNMVAGRAVTLEVDYQSGSIGDGDNASWKPGNETLADVAPDLVSGSPYSVAAWVSNGYQVRTIA